MRTASLVALTLATSLVLGGCATTVHGMHEDIVVGSTPREATVRVDGKVIGITPLAVAVSRSTKHEIRIERAGYRPYVTVLSHRTSGAFWLNIIASPFAMGFVIDAASGGMYDLTPDVIVGPLSGQDTAAARKSGALSIFGVLVPDSSGDAAGSFARR